MNNKKIKIAISGYYGFDNFGDDALLSVLVESLKNSGTEDITVFSKNPVSTKKFYKVKSCYSFDIFSLLKTLIKCDFLISGGGSLLQDSTSVKSLIYYLGVIFSALLFGKKVIIFAQGIGPIKNELLIKITKFLLKKCFYITVRDEKSLILLKNWGLNPILVSDPVWNLKIKTKYSHNAIGIQLREWETLTDDNLYELANCIVKLYKDKKIFIYALQKSLDIEVCDKLEYLLKKLNPDIHTHVILNRAMFEISESFSHIDELIAMRYHACLLGLKYGIKVLPIVYDPKVEKLADEFEIKEKIFLNDKNEFYTKISNFHNNEYKINTKKLAEKHFSFKQFENILLT